MVTDEAPRLFALVREIHDRVDATIVAWGMAFPDHVEVISEGRGGVRGVFSTAERAQRLFSTRHNRIRLVWVSTPQTHYLVQANSFLKRMFRSSSAWLVKVRGLLTEHLVL